MFLSDLPLVERADGVDFFPLNRLPRRCIPTRAISLLRVMSTATSGLPLSFRPICALNRSPSQSRVTAGFRCLQLGGPPPTYASVAIVAFPLRAKPSTDAKVVLRKTLDQELFYGVEELHGLSKTTLDGHQFYFYETRRGADQHMSLASNLEGYAVVVVLGANNEKAVKELESSFQHVTFVAPAKAREYAGADSWEYEGPAISSHRLAQLQADPPAKHIDPGKFTENVYENQSLGFHYRVQPGWMLEPEGAVQPAIERSKGDVDQPWMGAGERELMKICNRTLFSAWAKRPGTGGQLSYDDFGEVTVSAISTACFPGMKFPAKVERQAIN